MRVLNNIAPQQILFFDIETVRAEEQLTEDSKYYDNWFYKQRNNKDEDIFEVFAEKAALFSDCGKIVTISVGRINVESGVVTIVSFYEGCNNKIKDEAGIIKAFFKLLDDATAEYGKMYLCGHMIKDFDIPYIAQRAMVNRIPLQDMIDVSGKPNWELKHLLDTNELWRSTGYSKTSLIALTTAFGLENPKQDIQGHETSTVYYKGEIERIARYCERDVLAVTNILLAIKCLPPVVQNLDNINFADVPLLEKVAKLGKYIKEEAVKVVGIYDVLEENEKPIAEKLIEISFKKSLEELRNVK